MVMMTSLDPIIDDDPTPTHPRGGTIEIDEDEEGTDCILSSSDDENNDVGHSSFLFLKRYYYVLHTNI